MKLVIDCFKLVKGTGKSIGIYNVAQGIVRHIGSMNSDKREPHEIIVLGNSKNREDFDVRGVRFVEITDLNPMNKIHVLFWELFNVSQICKRLNADRIFFPRGYTALTHPVYDIVLIHDLIPFYYNEHFPGVFNKVENAYIMERLSSSARRAKKIVTISLASKEDIIKYCGVDENKIVVINNAVEEMETKTVNGESKKPYICAMTSSLPHKNAKGIVESYKKYCQITERPLDLVIIGLKDTNEFNLPKDIKDRIQCYKYINDNDEMYQIIGDSKCFLFLSLVEGFGLPPIEAMQLGVPVVCSNCSCFPEVVGDAACLVNPNDYDVIAKAIIKVTSEKEYNRMLLEKGHINAKRFSWASQENCYWDELFTPEKQ